MYSHQVSGTPHLAQSTAGSCWSALCHICIFGWLCLSDRIWLGTSASCIVLAVTHHRDMHYYKKYALLHYAGITTSTVRGRYCCLPQLVVLAEFVSCCIRPSLWIDRVQVPLQRAGKIVNPNWATCTVVIIFCYIYGCLLVDVCTGQNKSA